MEVCGGFFTAFKAAGGHPTDFKFNAEAVVVISFFGHVQYVDAGFGFHVKTVIGTDIHTGLARGASFPNDADSTIVIAWNKEPWFHFLKTFVWIHHSDGSLKVREQFRRLSIWCIGLVSDGSVSLTIVIIHDKMFFIIHLHLHFL